MKKILLLALIGATTSLMAMYAEHASLYKDPRIMGMGGANVAVGGYSTSVFSNPAGLAKIKKEHGIVVDLLGIGVSASGDSFLDFVDDFDAADGDTVAMGEVLKKYAGTHFHIGVDDYTAISKNSDAFAWSIGILAAADFNIMPHSDLSLSTSSRAYGGAVLGVAKPFSTEIGRLDVGMSVKYVQLESYEDSLGVTDLIGEDDLQGYIEDKLASETGVGVDIGITYYPFEDNFFNPAIGVSLLNIGSIDMNDAYGGQPMTLNVGASISPKVPYIDKLLFAVDYVDVLNANELRLYNGDGTYNDYEEDDVVKRFRAGVSLGLFDTSVISLDLNGGLYQGAYTAGIDLEFLLFKLSAATYEEQIGTGDVDISDRRYMAKIAIGW